MFDFAHPYLLFLLFAVPVFWGCTSWPAYSADASCDASVTKKSWHVSCPTPRDINRPLKSRCNL